MNELPTLFLSGVVSQMKDLVLPIATFSLSVAVGIVAFQQWRVARNKLRLDLFEKRYKVYNAALEFLQMFFVSDSFTDAEYGRFVIGTSGAEFLFGNDVVQYLTRIREEVAMLHMHQWHIEQKESKKDVLKHSRSKDERVARLKAQDAELRRVFGRYLGFGHIK